MTGYNLLNASNVDVVTRRAKELANKNGVAYGVWEHVGLYGQLGGDDSATHALRIRSLNEPDPSDSWALIACIDQDGV